MTTRPNLIQAASTLLDQGGEGAVTLRAVGQAAGVSHNAPYRHFRNRDALLAGVASADLETLGRRFRDVRGSEDAPANRLLNALGVLIAFSRAHPARYRLVFGAPTLARAHPDLQASSAACLAEIIALVDDCKAAKTLADAPTKSLAALFLAALHGLVLLEAQGQLQTGKGLPTLEQTMALMVDLFSP